MSVSVFRSSEIAGVTIGRVFTTTQVGRICGVSVRTVVKWTDQDKTLPCHRVPGTDHRRVTKAALVAFLHEHGLWDTIPAVSRMLFGLDSFADSDAAHGRAF